MKVNVSQKDIDNGVSGDGRECAIALAVRRAFKTDDVKVYVDWEDCGKENDRQFMWFLIKDKDYHEKYIDKYDHVLNFIDWFDNSIDGCEPFKFNINTTI